MININFIFFYFIFCIKEKPDESKVVNIADKIIKKYKKEKTVPLKLQIAKIGKSISFISFKNVKSKRLINIVNKSIIKENKNDKIQFCFLFFVFILKRIGIISKEL